MALVEESGPPPETVVRAGEYGDRVVAIEPGGVGFIPLDERHGRPLQLFWTWTSPNLEFATVFVGVLAVAVFGQGFWPAVLAILIGSALGSATHAVLSARGPANGVPQMVLSRLAFGYWGNLLPAGLNAVTAGIGWFAVNSVSGAFALNTLTHLPKPACLVIIVLLQVVVAFFGHNLVQAFERYAFPALGVVFLIASVIILAKSHPGAASGGGIGGFLLTVGAAFGYAAGWNPYAADYTRYLPPTTNRFMVGFWAGFGVFLSCIVLELAGAVLVTVAGTKWGPNDIPTQQLQRAMPDLVYYLTLLCIAVGAVAANAINIYSGTMSLVALGIREMGLTLRQRRALLAVLAGIIGYLGGIIFQAQVAPGGKYESFLLLISYWIAPWLAVIFVDYWLQRGNYGDEEVFYNTRHQRWQGIVAMAVGLVVSVYLFSNNALYLGVVPKANPSVGDLTFIAGFVIAAVLYYIFQRGRPTTYPVAQERAA
jgi:NCS1 nucleoside transporter family